MRYLGFTPIEAMAAATAGNAAFVKGGDALGTITPGHAADLLIIDGDPRRDVAVLLDHARITEVWLGGAPVERAFPPYRERGVSEFSLSNWNEVYTQERVARDGGAVRPRRAARGR